MSINVKSLEEETKTSAYQLSEQILNFNACLQILEEAEDQEGMGYDYATGARSGDDNDYDDEVPDEDFDSIDNYQTVISDVNIDSKKYNPVTSVISVTPFKKSSKIKFQREVNVSAYIEGLRKRVLASLLDHYSFKKVNHQITKQKHQYAEEIFEKSQQLKKLVLSFEYAAPTIKHQSQRDNEIASQINYNPVNLHMKYLAHSGPQQQKQHFSWLKQLKESAYDRLVDRYFVPSQADSAKDPIVMTDESNWARPSQNIGITFSMNKHVEIKEEQEWFFYSNFLKQHSGKPSAPAVISRNDNVSKGKSSQPTSQGSKLIRSVMSRGVNNTQSSTLLPAKTVKNGRELNKIEEVTFDDQYLIQGLPHLEAYKVTTQDQMSDLIFLTDHKHSSFSQQRGSTTTNAHHSFVTAVQTHLDQIGTNERVEQLPPQQKGMSALIVPSKQPNDYTHNHGGFKNTYKVKNQSFNKTLASMRKYQQLYQERPNQKVLPAQQKIKSGMNIPSEQLLHTDYSPSKEGDAWLNCAENPQGAPPGDFMEQRFFYREQEQQPNGWYGGGTQPSFQNNYDDESEQYPLLEQPIQEQEIGSRINIRQAAHKMINYGLANTSQLTGGHKRNFTMQNRESLKGERSSCLDLDQSAQRIFAAQSSTRKLGREQQLQQPNREGYEVSKLNLFALVNQPDNNRPTFGQHASALNKGDSQMRFGANGQKRTQSLHNQIVVLGLQNQNGGIYQEGRGVALSNNKLNVPLPEGTPLVSYQNSSASSYPRGNIPVGAAAADAPPQILLNGLEPRRDSRGKPQIPFPSVGFASVSSPTGKNSGPSQHYVGQLANRGAGGRDSAKANLKEQPSSNKIIEQKFSKFGGNTKISRQNNDAKEQTLWAPATANNGSSTRLQFEQLQKLQLTGQSTLNDRNLQHSQGLTTSSSVFKNARQALDAQRRGGSSFTNGASLHTGSSTANSRGIVQPAQRIPSKLALFEQPKGSLAGQPVAWPQNGERGQQQYKHAARQIVVQQAICNYSQQQNIQVEYYQHNQQLGSVATGLSGGAQSNQFVPLKKQSKHHSGSFVGPHQSALPLAATPLNPSKHVPRIEGGR